MVLILPMFKYSLLSSCGQALNAILLRVLRFLCRGLAQLMAEATGQHGCIFGLRSMANGRWEEKIGRG